MLDIVFITLISIIAFIPLLCLIVFIHEYGHFQVARWCGVKVDVFSIGFGKTLWSRVDKHGTVWKVSALPLGGYVKFFGDANAASMPDNAIKDEKPQTGEEQDGEQVEGEEKPVTTQFPHPGSEEMAATMTEEERKVCFHFKPVWQRALVVAAGPVANFILAFVILYFLIWAYATKPEPAVILDVMPDMPAAEAGFEPGDTVLRVNGRDVPSARDFQIEVMMASGAPITVDVLRDGQEVELTVIPKRTEIEDEFGNVSRAGRIGVRLAPESAGEAYGPISAAPAAMDEVRKGIARTLKFFGRLLTGREDPRELGGPITMTKMAGQMVTSGFDAEIQNVTFGQRLEISLARWIGLAAMISLSIGFLNLLPVPVLDGGHLMYYAYEAIVGKPLNPKIQEAGFRVGIAILGTLMVFVFVNDILKLF